MTLGEPDCAPESAYSSYDNDTAPAGTQIAHDAFRFTRHEDHIHPVWPAANTHSAPNLRSSGSSHSGLETTRSSRPRRHTRIIGDYPGSDRISVPTECASIGQRFQLRRGLQVPSSMGCVTSGFKLPPTLEAYGVTKSEWMRYTAELKSHAKMTGEQFKKSLPVTLGITLICNMTMPLLGTIPAARIVYEQRKVTELNNFWAAHEREVLKECTRRWNETYFEPLGLHAILMLPGNSSMENMDLASSKLYKYQQKMDVNGQVPGVPPHAGGYKEARYKAKEGRHRRKAIRKARIVFLPVQASRNHSDSPQESAVFDRRDYFEDIERRIEANNVSPRTPNSGWLGD